jgi:hypothetical protein
VEHPYHAIGNHDALLDQLIPFIRRFDEPSEDVDSRNFNTIPRSASIDPPIVALLPK